MQAIFLRKKVILALSFLFSLLFLVPAFAAWKELGAATCPAAGSEDTKVSADVGDVVTVDKWNQTWCSIRNIKEILTNWPSGSTYFVGIQNKSDGKPLVTEVNLPSSLPTGTNGFAGSINFKDPSVPYAAANAYKAGMAYNGNNKSITFLGDGTGDGKGGVRIVSNPTAEPTGYLVGWDKVNKAGSDNFDVNCQYRATLGGGTRVVYPVEVTPTALKFISNQSNTVVSGEIKSNPKSGEVNWLSNPEKIEKLCLPTHNTNNY